MAEKATYVSASGFVQFEPAEREANGQTVIDYTIKTPGPEGTLVRITVWPELQGTPIEQGDFLAVDGKLTVSSFTGRDGVSRQSVQISASNLAVVPSIKAAERKVVNKGKSAKAPF